MNSPDLAMLETYAAAAVDIARQAGEKILEVYDRGFDVDTKTDGSPVTTADRLAHDLIVARLAELDPDIPVLSEESAADSFQQRRGWTHYWLIDPLDGTKEFISRRGEFTVNIALVSESRPVLGVVHTPVQQLTHWAWVGGSAFRQQGPGIQQAIVTREHAGDQPVVVASRSHGRGNLEKFLAGVEQKYGGYELASMGSALKICVVAEGKADVYPRLGPTSEWDTAAAHCVLDVAGGSIRDPQGRPLRYNKESILNPWFIASGGGSEDWLSFLADLDLPD